jgi:hypothetical protein
MEINKMSDVRGVVASSDIPEGSFVFILPNVTGSYTDLPAVRVPWNTAEAALSRFVVTWPVPYQEMPMYIPSPAIAGGFALRYGFDKATNLPLTSTTVHLTWPGNKDGVTIPSGFLALAFAGGVFTIPSGMWVYNASLIQAGASFTVSDKTTDGSIAAAGKVKFSASNVVGYVERYDATAYSLEVRTLVP